VDSELGCRGSPIAPRADDMVDIDGLRMIEGWVPGECDACGRQTEKLTRIRSIYYNDPDYVSDVDGHRAWFRWYCDLCYSTFGSTAHNHEYSNGLLYAHITQIGWRILDRLTEMEGV